MIPVLADAASNLGAARAQMALSLGWHIILACFGVGLPLLILIAEGLGHRRSDAQLKDLARRWAKTAGVLFAVGAVSGTILSFELGVLWPGLMETFGSIFGFPFALEGVAFFIEAIFLGVYLYGWDKLGPLAHWLSGLPIVVAGVASAFFVVGANAWMNQPAGFDFVNGKVTNADPIAALFNAATPIEALHMVLAAFMVTGFAVASIYAWFWLRGNHGSRTRAGFLIGFTVAAICTPPQIVVGDMAARFVATHQPAKLAAMEALAHTGSHVAEHIGGFYVNGKLRGDIEIPDALSLLVGGSTDKTIIGLDSFPADQQPAVNVVHSAFDVMVALGFGLLVLAAWAGLLGWRRHRLPAARTFWRGALLAGPAAVVAMECGWIVTEVGRQPWIVYRVMRTADAVNPAPGLWIGLVVLIVVYSVLTAVTVGILLAMNKTEAKPVLPS
jgi:cytochrome bd ubiquinol oxidase subunit I